MSGEAGSKAASPPHQSDEIPTQDDTATSGIGSSSNVVEDIAEHIVTGVEQVFTPRLRGFIHLHAVWIAVAAGAVLVSVSWALVGMRAGLATLAYTIATVALFAVSATYHRVQWKSATAEKWMTRADHSMIFIFIAGCYTPFALVAFPSAIGSELMWIVWSGALAGVTLKLFWPSAPRWVGVPLYMLLGWVSIWYAGALLEHAGVTAVVLLVVGGGFYSIGAIFYATSWPNPWPATFGHHEFFHACTVIAAICHYIAIWFAVFHT